ncbi:GNAT family N-acetyltransferase [Kribbella sandramycini]|uniref:GNAT family N-acetyltransferase n=1 Tax=Kribbella sandramycini TaxID=60450 RepID=A0A7Y4L5E9_9ACTN|nr:GNAT family protein [Kribbella sandramycini]MBB6570545.1 RimJ/RimL family protein N-acetyltransferase [Kribbella sandramycini]NOL43691.1 GNAT family N-acetyltransferase [Kribbella sandramycini]
MTVAPDGRSLVGDVVRLDPLQDGDYDELYAAIGNEQVYAGGFNGGVVPADVAAMRAEWTPAIAKRFAYTVRMVADGTVVGTSSLGDVDLVNERIHLGWTGYAPAVWGTAVNPATKLLLMRHAFEDCGFGRLKIQTGLKNTHSQAAIAKLGATREGVLRRHMLLGDGTWRDTVVFSILADEWPTVRQRLEERINR